MSVTNASINGFLQAPAGSGGQPALFYASLYQNDQPNPGNVLNAGYVQNLAYLVQQQQASINLAEVKSGLPSTSSTSPVTSGNSSSPTLYSPLVTTNYSVPGGLYADAVTNQVSQQQTNIAVTDTRNSIQSLLQAAKQTAVIDANDAKAATNFAQGSNITSISDLLQSANGQNGNSSLSNALQAQLSGSSTGLPDPNAALASILSPGFDPNSSVSSVADFVNTSPDAFAPPAPDNNSSGPASATPDSSSQDTSSNNNDFPQTTSDQVGIYNDIANASASTIRGTSVNTVA